MSMLLLIAFQAYWLFFRYDVPFLFLYELTGSYVFLALLVALAFQPSWFLFLYELAGSHFSLSLLVPIPL